MQYNTPELLLVGAAQNLVLGTQLKRPSGDLCYNHDDDLNQYGPDALVIEDSACW